MTAFKSYYNGFEAFKNQDRIKIVNELVMEYISLDKLYISVISNPGEFLESILGQQEVIKERIGRFKGFENLKEAREEFGRTLSGEGIKVGTDFLGPVDQLYKVEEDEDVVMTTDNEAVTNQLLAHELVLNPEFKLKKDLKSPLQERVAKVASQVLIDIINEQVKKGEYSRFLGLIGEIGKVTWI